MAIIIENQLFPSIDFIKILIKGGNITIEKCEWFQKMTFRNRYVIAGANGILSLTIPVKGGREQKILYSDIEIDHSYDWRKHHWRSILSVYKKAPFFDHYAEEVKKLIFTQETNLFNFNIFILRSVLKTLNINVLISFTSEYKKRYEDNQDFRNFILPKSFQNEGLKWRPKYSQVFEDRIGFQPNLSILDLLFCEGPNSGDLIKKCAYLLN